MYYVYILQSEVDRRLYVGYSKNLKQRLRDHNQGKNISTKGKTPLRLVYYEAFLNKKDALGREKYLKSGYGQRSIQKLLKTYFEENQ